MSEKEYIVTKSWIKGDEVGEEIVRCRDCVYAGEQGLNGCQRWWSDYIGGYPRLKIPKVDPDGFCAWGKRKSE